MGTVIQLLERSIKPLDTPADANPVDAIRMLSRAIKDQTAVVARKCETLSRSIGAVQRNLKMLDGIVGMIDDPETCEKLQHQLKLIDASLFRQSARLRFHTELLQDLTRLHVL